ncbi:hypothetical protein KC19_VG128900 [Ceratodon purpureus]|uniref:Uncharacterized protein n=1 Tax=Ceratodon purpureus TaxID=3225 RepID=A0A8T0HPX2_CERPU|nr:hypothetical protein KC19_VG128900 [Ceratodon purpureus]
MFLYPPCGATNLYLWTWQKLTMLVQSHCGRNLTTSPTDKPWSYTPGRSLSSFAIINAVHPERLKINPNNIRKLGFVWR